MTALEASNTVTDLRRDFLTDYAPVQITEAVLLRAMDLIEKYGLRGYDSLQLASAAQIAAERTALGLAAPIMVCADIALNAAATAEGACRRQSERAPLNHTLNLRHLLERLAHAPHLSAFLLVCLCVLRPGSAVRAGAPPHRAVAGPFTVSRDNGTPLVEVTFSSGKTGLFMIDTGSYDCLITPGAAKRLGFKQDRDTLTVPTVRIHDLRIGRLQVSDITFRVAEGDVATENGRPVDGLIGGTLLSRFALLLDYSHRTLAWVYPGDLDDTTVAELGFDPKSGLGLHQEEYPERGFKINHYSTRVQLQDGSQKGTEEMFFDTGSPMTSLSAETARRMKLVSTGSESFRFVFQSPDSAYRSTVPSLQIGPQIFTNVSLIYPTHPDSYMVPLIGENVLGGCAVLFDFGPHRCFLQPRLPGLTTGPLPPLDTRQIDWERLRNAPEPLEFRGIMIGVLFPEILANAPLEIARLRTSPTGGTETAEHDARLGMLLRNSDDEPDAKEMFGEAVRLRRTEADAHPEDPVRAAQWTEALVDCGQEEAAITAAEKDAAKWPASPVVLRALGAAQETRAEFLLFGGELKTETDDEALDPFLDPAAKPVKPDSVRVQQIALLRQKARENFGRAVALAPLDPESYNRRARFWRVDRLLLTQMDQFKIKGQLPSVESALAAEMADYRVQARLRPDDAALLRRIIRLDTDQPHFHNNSWFQKQLRGTGQETELQGDEPLTAKAALAHLTALAKSSDSKTAAPALEALGEAQADTDDPASEATLRQAVAQDPARSGALVALASLMIADNRLSALGDVLLKQSDKAPTPASCLLLSETLSAVGQTATAEEEAREALKLLPDSPEVNMALARLLLARSGDDPSVLPEAGACVAKAETGLGKFTPPQQKAAVQTLHAVWQALSGDPAGARTQLLQTLHDQPACTQAREALYALSVPPAAP